MDDKNICDASPVSAACQRWTNLLVCNAKLSEPLWTRIQLCSTRSTFVFMRLRIDDYEKSHSRYDVGLGFLGRYYVNNVPSDDEVW